MTATIERKSISVAKKLEILQKANETGNLKGTIEVYEVQPYQLCYWQAQVQQLIGKLFFNRRAKTLHSGYNAYHIELECTVYSWETNHGNVINVTELIVVVIRNFRESLQSSLLSYAWTFTFGFL